MPTDPARSIAATGSKRAREQAANLEPEDSRKRLLKCDFSLLEILRDGVYEAIDDLI